MFKNTEIKSIKKLFKNKIIVLAGQSGSGKSTLLNNLNVSLNLETGEISKKLGRGKHTTRYTSLISLFDGYVIDSPGFSSLNFNEMTKKDIKNGFIEFNNYQCQYKDCMHIKEEGCKIKENLNILASRYCNYTKFLEEVEK